MVFAAVFLIMLSSVIAGSGFVQAWGESLKELEGQTLPGALGTLFGNEQINFHIQLEDGGEAVIGLVVENKIVKSVSSSGVAEPTLNVYTSEATITEIVNSASPPNALLNALKEEKITYKAVGFFNKIKFAFLSVFSNIAALFTSEEAVPAAGTAADKAAAGDTAAGSGAVAGAEAGQTAAVPVVPAGTCATAAAGTAGGCTETGTATGTEGTAADTSAGAAGGTAAGTETTTGSEETATGAEGNAVDTTTGAAVGITGTGAATGTEGMATSTDGTAAGAAAGSQMTSGTVAEVESKPDAKTYTVKMTNEGFSKNLITINAGDTVVWENVRTNSVLNKAMIIGMRECRKVKSALFLPGESFSWTFEEPGVCVVVDGIMTTQSSKVIIE